VTVPGQLVVILPDAVRYQLLHMLHTESASRLWMRASNRRSTPASTSTAQPGCSTSHPTRPVMCRACDSSMYTIDPDPRLVLGP